MGKGGEGWVDVMEAKGKRLEAKARTVNDEPPERRENAANPGASSFESSTFGVPRPYDPSVPQRDLGILNYISAEAVGQPGQRRFRLLALSDIGESGSLWLEKEQLVALAEAITNVLRDEGFTYVPRPMDDMPEPPVFPLNADVDFRLAQLSMGLDRDNRRIVLIAADGPEDEDTLTVNMSFAFPAAHELRQEIERVVAAGRPPCPLCTAPMDPSGHVCVRTNGHQPH